MGGCSVAGRPQLQSELGDLRPARPDQTMEGKELERGLSSDSPLYEAQHFSPGLPSLLARPPSERTAWVPQWPQMWSMAAPQPRTQHRTQAQVWGDPAFRPFFPDPAQDQSVPASSGGFRSPWEPPHDVKTLETVLNSVVEQQPLNYRADLPPFRQQAENLTASSSSPATSSPAHSQGGDTALNSEQFYHHNTAGPAEAGTFQHPGYTSTTTATTATAPAAHYGNSPSEPANLTIKTAESEVSSEENRPEMSPDLPKDLSCDRHTEEYPRDYSASYERRENSRAEGEEQEESYNIIKNMTEKYGESAVKQTEEVPSQIEQG